MRFLLITILLLVPFGAYAQDGQVKGVVRDAMGEPVIGATVAEEGNLKNAVVTDMNGAFTLNMSGKSHRVQVSYVGMETQTVRVTPGGSVDIELKEAGFEIGEEALK